MDNMGGVSKLYVIDADDIAYFGPAVEDIYTLGLAAIDSAYEIPISNEGAGFSETEEDTDNGFIYNFEVTARIPKVTQGDMLGIEAIRQKSLCIGITDMNGQNWLFGYPGSYFSIIHSKDSGQAAADLNHAKLKISAGYTERGILVNSFSYVD